MQEDTDEAKLWAAGKRILELERMLRPGASEVLNEMIAADLAHVNPVSGEISLTFHGQVIIDRAKAALCNPARN